MAHFAKLGRGNIVEKVEVISNDIATTEEAGVNFLRNLYGTNDVWKQTWIDSSQRKNFAGIGFTYREDLNGFVAPCKFSSWILNEETCKWEAPTPMPTDGQDYYWHDESKTWKLKE